MVKGTRLLRAFPGLFWAIAALFICGESSWASINSFAASVVRVRAVAADGSVTFGSAVAIAVDTLATACHVTRSAEKIELSQGVRRWIAEGQRGSLAHDLCLLTVRNLELPVISTRRSTDLNLGERIIAAGFPNGGELVLVEGAVEGLYPHDGGPVIRTSARVDFGASGGGLFDESGNLVGFLAFKGRTGQSLNFALPVEWIDPGSAVASSFAPIASQSAIRAFWDLPQATRPSFLGAAILEAASQ